MDPLTMVILLAGVVATVASSWTNAANVSHTNAANTANTAATNASNQQIAADDRQFQLEQWERQNAYDSPAAQMQRYRAAGLNPALMMSSSGLVQGQPMGQPVTAAGSMRTPNLMPAMVDFGGQTMMSQASNIALTESQARLNNANAAQVEETLPKKVEQMELENRQLQEQIAKTNQEVVNLKKQVDLMSSEERLNLQRSITEEFNRGMRSKEYDLSYKQFEETLRMNDSLRKQIAADIGLKDSQRLLNKQSYDYYTEANVKLLLGLDYQNQLIQSQEALNRINQALGGFEVNAGYIRDQVNQDKIYSYEYGSKFQKRTIRFFEALDGMIEHLPVIGKSSSQSSFVGKSSSGYSSSSSWHIGK